VFFKITFLHFEIFRKYRKGECHKKITIAKKYNKNENINGNTENNTKKVITRGIKNKLLPEKMH
jgi:hypothetical protein